MSKKIQKKLISILMGSKSDLSVMQHCRDILEEFGVASDVRILSAHRCPEALSQYIKIAEKQGIQIFIAAAGMAAHLAGAVAAQTSRPVIGVPLDATLGGIDSLLSTVQMPGGVPVATVSIGKAGAKNAAILAVEILALQDKGLFKKIINYRSKMAKQVEAADELFQQKGS